VIVTASLVLVSGCGSSQLARDNARGRQLRAQEAQDALTGLPNLSAPEYGAARARFEQDEAVYRRDPERFVNPGEAIECPLAVEYEAELWMVLNEGPGESFRVYQGQCAGGRLHGPAVIGFTYQGEAGVRRDKLVVATFDDGALGGEVAEYQTYVIPANRASGTAASARAEIAYAHYDGVAKAREYRFYLRRDDPAWKEVVALEPRGDRGLEQRMFFGAVENWTRFWRTVGPHRFQHGPWRLKKSPAQYVGDLCYDYDRIVLRAGCAPDMPVTEGIPADSSALASKPTHEPTVLLWRTNPGTGVAETFADVPATRANVERSAQSKWDALSAHIAKSLSERDPARPRLERARVPSTTARSTSAPTRPPVPPPPAPAAAPARATLPPKAQADALCAAAAARQAELYAPGDAKLRATMKTSFHAECKKRNWSMERITCALAAADAGALGTCDAMPAAEPDIKAGEPAACNRAAANQARLIAPTDASLQKTLSKSIEKACKSDRWSAERIRCVERATSSGAASGCSD
jgi:hypothetical protein